jgi:hypothetical protein
MSIIFNSVTDFVEQVGRRRVHKSKTIDLDTMSCVFTGPTWRVGQYIPRDRTPHPDFAFMTSTGWSVRDIEAGVSELSIDYVGKFESGPIMTDTQWHEGSISWSSYVGQIARTYTPGFTSLPATGPTGELIGATIIIDPQVAIGYLTLSYLCRYVVSSIISRYLSRGGSGFVNEGIGDPQVTNQVRYITGANSANDKFGSVTAELVFEKTVNEQISDLGNGWFVVEVTTTLVPVIQSSANTQATTVPLNLTINTTMPAWKGAAVGIPGSLVPDFSGLETFSP